MKLPCKTVEDLLPLYHDSVCSKESRCLVEEHLADCPNCKKILAELDDEPQTTEVRFDDTTALRSLHRQWSKALAKAFLKGIALTCMVCVILFGAGYLLTQWHCVPVSSDVLEVSNLCQMEDGPLLFQLTVKDGKNMRYMGTTFTEDGSLYWTPKHAILEGSSDRRVEGTEFYKGDYMLDLEWIEESRDSIKAFYIGPVGSGILVWEEGMELPPASREQEEGWGPLHEAHIAK